MTRSKIIATCLVNSSMISNMADAEVRVRSVFAEEFPKSDYDRWNRNIDEHAATQIIRRVGRASRINVKLFIEDLAMPEE